jgi:hypothetical protein
MRWETNWPSSEPGVKHSKSTDRLRPDSISQHIPDGTFECCEFRSTSCRTAAKGEEMAEQVDYDRAAYKRGCEAKRDGADFERDNPYSELIVRFDEMYWLWVEWRRGYLES